MAFLFPRKINLKDGIVSVKYYIGWYEKKYTSNGDVLIRKNKSTKCKSKAEANLALKNFNPGKEIIPENKRIKCSDFLEDYISDACKQKSPGQIKNIRKAFKKFIEILGDRYLQHYDVKELDKYFSKLLDTDSQKKYITEMMNNETHKLSCFTVKNYRSDLMCAFEQAKKWKYIESNPFTDTNEIELEEPEIIPFTKEEFLQYLSVINNEIDKEWSWISLYTGLRSIDLVNIKLDHINLIGRMIKIVNEKRGKRTKNKKTNYVEIAEAIVPIIQKAMLNNKEYLFEKKRGGGKFSQHTIQNRVKKYVHAGGLNPKLNHKAFRKSHVTWLHQEGAEDEQLARQLHHSNSGVTKKHYRAVLQPKPTGIVNKLSSIVTPQSIAI